MQIKIKVTDTIFHNGIPVVEGEFVLIECKKEEGGLLWKNNHGNLLKDFTPAFGWNTVKCFKPIFISETERIEVGDVYLMFIDDKWEQMEPCHDVEEADRCNNSFSLKDICFKVLALPKHFSAKHLQAIVDGKLKDGDKVLVECEYQTETIGTNEFDFEEQDVCYIKLNSSNHITLHKIEEKMCNFTADELKELLNQFSYAVCESATIEPLGDEEHAIVPNIDIDRWFDQNVK